MKALNAISSLTVEESKPVLDSATYPAPEDDSAWNDSRKLNP